MGEAPMEQWEEVERCAEAIARSISGHQMLPHVSGGGRRTSPRLALVFINPTARNSSTRDGWQGARHPWIGTKAVWRVLANAGLISTEISREIERNKLWTPAFAEEVYADVERNGIYITNLVKWTGPNGDLPSADMVRAFSALTIRELALVAPKAIVAFGGMTVRALTGQQPKLVDVLESTRRLGRVPELVGLGLLAPVLPCYFPVGRGNPKAATEILTVVNNMY